MIISQLIAIGFLGSIFAMFRFAKYCRLLNSRNHLTQEEEDRCQAKAKQWLAIMVCLLGTAALAMIAGIAIQIMR